MNFKNLIRFAGHLEPALLPGVPPSHLVRDHAVVEEGVALRRLPLPGLSRLQLRLDRGLARRRHRRGRRRRRRRRRRGDRERRGAVLALGVHPDPALALLEVRVLLRDEGEVEEVGPGAPGLALTSRRAVAGDLVRVGVGAVAAGADGLVLGL